MRIATFFQPIRDCENLDLETQITVPDQSLTVRDILTRFTRGQIEIPPLDTGVDDDIDDVLDDFDDITEAMDSIASINRQFNEEGLKKSPAPGDDDKAKRSEAKEDSPDPEIPETSE